MRSVLSHPSPCCFLTAYARYVQVSTFQKLERDRHVRLGWVRLGWVRLGRVRLGRVRLGRVRLGWGEVGWAGRGVQNWASTLVWSGLHSVVRAGLG